MKVAAWQAPLREPGTLDVTDAIQARIRWCETEAVSILCCPEAVLGGLADYVDDAGGIALRVDSRGLADLLAPLASDRVTTIVGFTELGAGGQLFNSAAVIQGGRLAGVYRKRHPAIRRSVYSAGTAAPVFSCGSLTFGIVICNDSNFAEPARQLAAQGAAALFVPTNNGLPPGRAGPEIVEQARQV